MGIENCEKDVMQHFAVTRIEKRSLISPLKKRLKAVLDEKKIEWLTVGAVT